MLGSNRRDGMMGVESWCFSLWIASCLSWFTLARPSVSFCTATKRASVSDALSSWGVVSGVTTTETSKTDAEGVAVKVFSRVFSRALVADSVSLAPFQVSLFALGDGDSDLTRHILCWRG